MKNLVRESIVDLLKPKSVQAIVDDIQKLSVNEKVNKIKEMQRKYGSIYANLIQNEEIKKDIVAKVKEEIDQFDILKKINYIENLEHDLPDLFEGMRDDNNLLNDLKTFILNQSFEDKSNLIWRFFKSWPDLFNTIEIDPKLDDETNKMMLLFKIKRAIDTGEIKSLQNFIHKMGKKYGRNNVLDFAKNITINNYRLFNKKQLKQLKLSLYKETRSAQEKERDENYNVYAFISYPDYKDIEIDGKTYSKKKLGIENLIKIDKYNAASLMQVNMMKMRQVAQYGNQEDSAVFGVYVPKDIWDVQTTYNKDIPDDLRSYIDKNKFKL
jgi:hypothetical protein